MHQTISGETHKIKIVDNDKNFIKNERKKLSLIKKNTNHILYDQNFVVSSKYLNYLNQNVENKNTLEFKNILKKEFDSCEKIYPYLGDLFIESLLGENVKKEFTLFDLEEEKDFLSSFQNKTISKIAKIIFSRYSLKNNITCEFKKIDEVYIEKFCGLEFDIDFDKSYTSNGNVALFDYNFIIIDGVIDSIGEIHHLLQKAYENKESYVIFCLGINDEVKNTIIKNNKLNNFKVYPIDITFDEYALNIMNDIALIHNSSIVSSALGQTISQEVRNKLKKGKKIIIKSNSFLIEPVCDAKDLLSHQKYLKKKLEKTNQFNRKYIEKRMKTMSTDKIKIYLPERLNEDNIFIRELRYFLFFLENIRKTMLKIKKFNDKKFYYVPAVYVEYVENVKNSFTNTLENVKKIILFEKESNA